MLVGVTVGVLVGVRVNVLVGVFVGVTVNVGVGVRVFNGQLPVETRLNENPDFTGGFEPVLHAS